MTPRQWRERGFKTIFRPGRHFLYEPATDVVRLMPLTQIPDTLDDCLGVNLSHAPEVIADLRATVHDCYCDQGVDTCDFCSGLRTPPSLEMVSVPDPTPYALTDAEAAAEAALQQDADDAQDAELDAQMAAWRQAPPLTEAECGRFEVEALRRQEREWTR